jgi:subtilisin family serine protease
MRTVAAVALFLFVVCVAPFTAYAQPSFDVEQLVARFPALNQPETTSEFLRDPAIRRETKNLELEQQYTRLLSNIVVREQDRFTKRLLRDESAKELRDAQIHVENKQLLLRDAEGRADLFAPMGDVLTPMAEEAKKLTATDIQKARDMLVKALTERDQSQSEAAFADTQAKAAESALNDTATQLDQIAAQRRQWVITNSQRVTEELIATYEGALTERGVVVIQFNNDATIDTIAAILDRHQLDVRSGIAELRIFITTIKENDPDEPSAVAMAQVRRVAAAVGHEPEVVSAVQNTVIAAQIVPPPTSLQDPNVCWDWQDGACEGNAAAKAIRFPAAWNFNDCIKADARVRVAVLDVGFDVHEDLTYTLASACQPDRDTHGNEVLGIIGANWGDGRGLDGGTPFAELIACAPGQAASSTPTGRAVVFSRIVWTFYRLLASNHPRIVNISLGYKWVEDSQNTISPEDRIDVQSVVRLQGIFVRAIAQLFKDVIVTSAAGNECRDVNPPCGHLSKWSSPFNWAALNEEGRASNIFVVESTDNNGTRSLFSSINGNISAPGEDIACTFTTRVPTNAQEAEVPQYAVDSGTSLAAPEVAAVIALMLAYNPALQPADVANILGVGTTPHPPLDAFRAMILSRPDRSLIDLADLDHNGSVGWSDFLQLKKRLHEVQLHSEFSPREDLNGDGELSRDQKKLVPLLEQELTDIEVLLAAWTEQPKPTLEELLKELDQF